MTVKSLRKQLAAAIAMTLVATVALGSSTYAWFVSNNQVKATTSTISAQSNAAFMYIRREGEDSKDLTADTSAVTSTALYPTHWATPADVADDTGNYYNKTAAQFYTAYGTDANDGTMVDTTLAEVGTPAQAVTGKYAVLNTFFVGSKGTTLTNLTVTAAALVDENGDASISTNDDLDGALRILVTCGSNWVLCDQSSILASNNTNILASTVSSTETQVDIYVFYDGDDAQVFTNNLPDLKEVSKCITVTFDATPTTNQTP